MIFQLQNLDRTTSHFLPTACRSCGWWQGHAGGWQSEGQREAWTRQAEELFGGWGKLALVDDQPLGMIQYGPSVLFPGISNLPCGPASADSMLMTCSMVTDDSYLAVRKSLVLAAVAELQELQVETVEAFCYQEAAAGKPGHLFDKDLLRESGFYAARSSGGVQLMRLELGGIERSRSQASRSRSRVKLLDRIKRPSPSPYPVTPCCRNPASRRGPAGVPRIVSGACG